MAFGKSKAPTAGAPVSDITEWMVKSALQQEWFTLALSRFQNPFSTEHELGRWDRPLATGLVHFETGTDRVIRADLTFTGHEDKPRPGAIGGAFVHETGGENSHVVFSVQIHDPRGKLASELQAAFDSAALSKSRFVHVAFKRPKIEDLPAVMTALGGGRDNAFHPVTQMFIRRETILPEAPTWAWAWKRDL